jgi:UDPglucose 6-dehydrogenase
MRIGIIGMGHVGRHTQRQLELRHETVGFDRTEGVPMGNRFEGCSLVVVCVGTPSGMDGAADISDVRECVLAVPPDVDVIVRSTVPPGTCRTLSTERGGHVLFWPEYVGEQRFDADTFEPLRRDPFAVVGGDDRGARARFTGVLAHVLGPLTRLHQTSTVEAELVKYMENSFFAVKVAFVNEFRGLVEAVGADWQSVREGWLLDPRVSRDHSDAFDEEPGFAGRCLPKDLSAITTFADGLSMDLTLLRSVNTANVASRSVTAES